VFFAPKFADAHFEHLRAGRARVGKTLEGFDVVASVPMVLGDDPVECAKPVRPYTALYIGGMGSREQNFYNALAVRMGYADEAADIQDRYLSRDYDGAAAAVPAEFVDATSLLGPAGRIADRMAEFANAGVTTLSLTPYGATMGERVAVLRTAVDALERSGASE
jgi:alkanesulfonate monooxygenase SsuD/methylene tetrahydromethanopterin reductase-like flavin-dependent oxidoreductase (luciferase family)